MTDEKKKLTIRESLGLLGFGFKTAHRLLPEYFPGVLMQSAVTAAQPLAVLFFSSRILNELTGSRNVSNIVFFESLTIGLTYVLSVIKAFLTREIETRAGREQALRRIHMMQAEKFASMDYPHTEDSSVSEVLSRMDVYARGSSRGLIYLYIVPARASDSLFSLVFSSILLTNAFSAGGIASDSSAAKYALIALFAAGILIGLRLQSRQKTILQKTAARAASDNTLANYYSNYVKADQAAKDVRLYNQKDALRGIFNVSYDPKTWVSLMNFQGRVHGFQLGLLAVISGGFYLLAGYSALVNPTPVGSIVQTVGAVSALAAAIGALIANVGMIYNNAPFLAPMREFLSLPRVLHEGTKTVPTQVAQDRSAHGQGVRNGTAQGPDARNRDAQGYNFEFRNVTFRYPGADKNALNNLDLRLTPGERLAVVGLNGSGKTTMVKLLCRLFEPTEGQILLNGVDIREYDFEQYAALFSVVFQDFALFPLWLGQNVAAGGSYDERRAKDCLDSAGFAERLETMPGGLDAVLYKEYDEGGTQISGGEAQKIALARALYKNAPVMVLDEPTAALDPIAEYEVYTAFDRIIGDKTAVFISHRLSSCRFCERVAVFDAGRLVQLGVHDELLADAGGRYRELWEAQASHYREA